MLSLYTYYAFVSFQCDKYSSLCVFHPEIWSQPFLKGVFRAESGLYYVRAFWITSLASPAAISTLDSGLASNLIILVCAFVAKLHWFSAVLPHSCFSNPLYYFQVLVLKNMKIFSKVIYVAVEVPIVWKGQHFIVITVYMLWAEL